MKLLKDASAMKNSLSPKALNPKLFFSLLFLYQLFFTFQGLDLSDEGFFGTFYQQIFNHPDSVQYNFMFWLSGVVGGAFDYIFGGLGIWGQRLFATLITTATIILVYNLLKKYLDRGRLQIALFIVLVTMNNQTKVFHYNFLSVLLYVTTAILLFKGLQKGNSTHLPAYQVW
jgi:4-amino-4-deoxy-L-arabinose transferase-like glycosyltransferase